MNTSNSHPRLTRKKAAITVLALLLAVIVVVRIARNRPPERIHHDTRSVLDPDNEPTATAYARLEKEYGPVPRPDRSIRIGVVLKFFGNQYWQLLAKGMQTEADRWPVVLDIQAAANENDPEDQARMMMQMTMENYDAIIISPQTDTNLIRPVQAAREKGILVLNVNESGQEKAEFFIGPCQYEAGSLAAIYLIQKLPENAQVAVITGLSGAYAAVQRTRGFQETIGNSSLRLAAMRPGEWDLQVAYTAAKELYRSFPELGGIYCNNDVMALGAAQAVQELAPARAIPLVGTDGIEPAYEAIRAGQLDATVDSFPEKTGRIAIETVIRILGGQPIPRVVYSPQKLVDRNHFAES